MNEVTDNNMQEIKTCPFRTTHITAEYVRSDMASTAPVTLADALALPEIAALVETADDFAWSADCGCDKCTEKRSALIDALAAMPLVGIGAVLSALK